VRQKIARLKTALAQLNDENNKKIKEIKKEINSLKPLVSIHALQAHMRKQNNIKARLNAARNRGAVTVGRGASARR
jgi:hypothetical protein